MAKNAMSRQIADADDPLNTLATPSVSTGVGRIPMRMQSMFEWVLCGSFRAYGVKSSSVLSDVNGVTQSC